MNHYIYKFIFFIIGIVLIYFLNYYIYLSKEIKLKGSKIILSIKSKLNSNLVNLLSLKINKLKQIYPDIQILSYLNKITVSIFMVFIALIGAYYAYLKLKLFSISVLIFFIILFIIFLSFDHLILLHKKRLFKELPNYIISLKNYTLTNNNILYAFANTTPPKVYQNYISKFNTKITSGISENIAFNSLRTSIDIEKVNEFLIILEKCHFNGGDSSKLLSKYSNILASIIRQNELLAQKTSFVKLVLLILTFINVYLINNFIFSNDKYTQILISSLIGEIILNFNIISFASIMYFVIRPERMN